MDGRFFGIFVFRILFVLTICAGNSYWVALVSEGSGLSLRRIARIVREERRKHDYIVALFQMYLERAGVPRSSLLVMEEYKGLQPDIVWIHNGFPVVVFEVMDPDANIRDPAVRRRFESLLILPYIQVLRPWYVVLTDGISLFIYDYQFTLVYSVEDLESIGSEEEHKIRKILFLE